MPRKIEQLEELQDDLGRYKSLKPSKARSTPEIDRDFEVLMRDGYVVIENLIGKDGLNEIRTAIVPQLNYCGRNTFEGIKTQRIYSLLSKTRATDRLADHPRILGLMDKLFLPNFLLSLAQAINILPGQNAQLLHTDDSFYTIPRPRPALGAATIWAIDDFTETNGATLIIPGSHRWTQGHRGTDAESVPAVMSAGSVIVLSGTTWHGAGANHSDSARLAVTYQYCEAYVRQQEAFLLEIPRDLAARLSPEIQALIGYSIMPPFMGMVDGKHPLRMLEAKN